MCGECAPEKGQRQFWVRLPKRGEGGSSRKPWPKSNAQIIPEFIIFACLAIKNGNQGFGKPLLSCFQPVRNTGCLEIGLSRPAGEVSSCAKDLLSYAKEISSGNKEASLYAKDLPSGYKEASLYAKDLSSGDKEASLYARTPPAGRGVFYLEFPKAGFPSQIIRCCK